MRKLKYLLLAIVAGGALEGCATASGGRRAQAITDADAAAKRALANEAQIDPARIPPRTVAVVAFTSTTSDTLLRPLGYGLADLLVTDLGQSSQVQLVERMRLDAMLRELALVDQGITDPRTAPRVGRLVGARRLLIGNISDAGAGQVRVSARLVDVIAGTVEELVDATAPLERIFDAEKSLALRVFEEMGIVLTPAERARVELRATSQVAALVAFGKGRDAEARGDVAGAAQFFGEAVRLDAGFVAARNQLAAARAGGAPGSGVQRVLDLGVAAVNQPVATRVADAADIPVALSPTMTFLLTVRITP